MGYYTSYTLNITGCDNPDERIAEIRAFNDSAEYALDENGNTNESCKWYDHDTDLKWFSSQYPDELYTLVGEGEESGDMWKKYYKNGKEQIAKAVITYEEFNESKLV